MSFNRRVIGLCAFSKACGKCVFHSRVESLCVFPHACGECVPQLCGGTENECG